MTESIAEPNPVAPAAAGNAGAHFEAAVGAYYLLATVAGAEPRGLPGATITTVAFQQRMAKHPLDDVVVHATGHDGSAATLEIQAKRSMVFTASDAEFADVVKQLWAAAQKPEFESTRYETAVAISRTTTRVEHAIQDVLHWARVQDAAAFHANVQRKGFASDQMRDFVKVFRANLAKCGAPDDDVTVWKLLSRFQVLVFDFEAVGSAFEHFARERSRHVLAPSQASRAAELWNALIRSAASNGRAAGEQTRQSIIGSLAAEGGYQFAPEAAHAIALLRLAEEARFALLDVDDQIGGARLSRTTLVEQADTALVSAPVLNITGAPGTGKSMVLKRLVDRSQKQGRVIVLRGGRIAGGGWHQFTHVLNVASSAQQFFTDLASAGGATLFVDNIDQIEDQRERATISDLLDAAADYPGWRVVVTTTEQGKEWTKILPVKIRAATATLTVPEISEDEATFLSEQNSALADLLRPDHPAKNIARNLFYLARLASADSAEAGTISTETDLARLWWGYGGGRDVDNGRFARLKAIRKMGAEFLAHPGRPATKTDDLESPVVVELLKLSVAREEVQGAEIAFRHDVYRDWTVGFMIADDPPLLGQLSKDKPVPVAIVRGLELSARLALDADPTGDRWLRLLSDATGENVHGSWRRPILLALPRAEQAAERLKALKSKLLANDGAILAELVRLLVVVDSIPASEFFSRLHPDFKKPVGAGDLVVPKGPAWWPTISWLVSVRAELPTPVIPDIAKAFLAWLMLTSRFGASVPLNSEVVAILFDWLDLLGEEMQPRSFRADEELPKSLKVPHHRDAYELVQMAAFGFALVNPEAARAYMAKLIRSDVGHREFQVIVKRRGMMAKAAPGEFADFFMTGVVDPEDDDHYSRRQEHRPFGYQEQMFLTAGPAQGPMLEMLQHSRADGLALVRRIVEHATNWQRKQYSRGSNSPFPRFTVPFVWGDQAFEGDAHVYRWARSGVPSALTTSALMALEAWGHERVEAGDDPEIILREILGPDGSSCAFIAVALDVILSHWSKFENIAWPFAASPQVLALDDARYVRDLVGVDDFALLSASAGSGIPSVSELKARDSRRGRMMNTFARYVLGRKEDIGPLLQAALERALKDIPVPPSEPEPDLLNGLYAVARRAARMADPANWRKMKGVQPDGSEIDLIGYTPDEAEQKQYDARSAEVNASTRRAEVIASISLAFRDDTKATPQVVHDAIAWARAEPQTLRQSDQEHDFEVEQAERAVIMSAVLAVRHINAQEQPDTAAWAETVLRQFMNAPERKVYRGPQVEYDRQAIAAAGIMALYAKTSDPALRPELLKLATFEHDSIVNALAAGFSWLRANDQRLLRSILRVLILTSSYVHRQFDDKAEERLTKHALVVERGIATELAWLKGGTGEPAWPQIAPWLVRRKTRIRVPGSEVREQKPRRGGRAPELHADESRLSLISSHLFLLALGDRPPWLLDLTKHFAAWAIEANGPDDEGRDADGRPFSLNGRFFEYLGLLVAALPHNEAMTAFIEPILALPDEACLDLIAILLHGFDCAVNSIDASKPQDVCGLRRVIADRLQRARGYKRFSWEKSFNCEHHLGDALRAMFYQVPGYHLGPRPRPHPPADFTPMLPTLTGLVTGAPTSGYLAILFLDLIELSPKPTMLPHVLDVVISWCDARGADVGFWGNYDIGLRTCAWFTKVLAVEHASLTAQQQSRLRTALDVLVRAGIAAARALEDFIDTNQPQLKASSEG